MHAHTGTNRNYSKKKRPAAQRQLAEEATGQVEAHLLQDRVPRGGGSQVTPDSLPQLPATATQLGRNQILPASGQKPRNRASTQRDEGRGEEDDSVSSCLFLGVGCCPVALRLLIIHLTLRRRRATGSRQEKLLCPLAFPPSLALRLGSCPEGVCAKAPPAAIGGSTIPKKKSSCLVRWIVIQ